MSQATEAEPTAASEPPTGNVKSLDHVRPRLRHDVVFADTGMGAFVRNTETGFLIRGKSAYRWLSTLAPHFNGELSLAELCDGLAEERRILITSMVRTLLERGFAKDAVEGEPTSLTEQTRQRFHRQIAFIDHYTDNAEARFDKYRTARVLIVGEGLSGRVARDALYRNGSEDVTSVAAVPTELEGYDMVVVCADEAGPQSIAAVCAALSSDGPAVLPVTMVGSKVLLGPLTRKAASPCWYCLLLRLHANVDAADMALLWRDVALGGSSQPALPSTIVAQVVGNAVAFDVFRLLTGALIGESAGAVLVHNTHTMETARERVLPHPACPQCHGDGPPAAAGPYPLEDVVNQDPSTPEQVHERLMSLVREHVGIVREFTDRELPQSPLKTSRCVVGGGRELVAFDIQMLLNARQSLMLRAAVSYVDELADLRRALPANDVPVDLRVNADRLFLASGAGTAEGPYLPVTDLRSQESVWVPAAAVHPESNANVGGAFEPTTAGCAGAVDLAAATEAGLLSALGYHGLRRAASGDPVTELDVTAFDDDCLRFLLASAATLGITVAAYALPAAAPAQAVLAVDTATPDAPKWTVGSGLTRHDAAVTALRDLVGQAQLAAEGAQADGGERLLAGFDPATVRTGAADVTTEWASSEELLEALHAKGVRALRARTTTPDLELAGAVNTVRVLLATS